MDDTHTYYVWYAAKPPKDGENPNQAPDDIPLTRCRCLAWTRTGCHLGSNWTTTVARTTLPGHRRGRSRNAGKKSWASRIVGIIMYRRLLLEQIKIVEDGGEPMNTFRDPAKNQMIMLPFDGQEDEGGRTKRTDQEVYGYGRRTARVSTGQAGKFNTTEIERAARAGATLPRPYPASGAASD